MITKWLTILICLVVIPLQAGPLADRFVWVFGWDLDREESVAEITKLIETAAQHGFNGAVVSGFDTLCHKSPTELKHLKLIQKSCVENHIELIPALFSVGYGGGFLSHNRNLAEGIPVTGAQFKAHSGEIQFTPDPTIRLHNGDFEEVHGTKLSGFNFYDQPGEVGFIDTNVFHGGKTSLRLEHFTANPHGHGRLMQEIKVLPHQSYRFTLWVRTAGLKPANSFQVLVLAGDREIAPRHFSLNDRGEWQKISLVFNSLDHEKVLLYAGVWGGREGKLWFDDWSLEETGPVNLLHRPGTPFTLKKSDGSITYSEGKDYALSKDSPALWRDDVAPSTIKIPSGSRIQEGETVIGSWYHSMVIYDSQVTVCMGEPEIYDIIDHEAKLLAELFHPNRILLNMDEVRMGGTCEACRGKDMAKLLGQCVTREAESLRRYTPGAQIYVWSDMFDPKINARSNYYLVKGDFTGSWKYLPKDIIPAVWGGEPQTESLKFFSGLGFETLGACYYDADDLKDCKIWLDAVKKTPRARGLMYTPWERKYSLLPEFGDMLK